MCFFLRYARCLRERMAGRDMFFMMMNFLFPVLSYLWRALFYVLYERYDEELKAIDLLCYLLRLRCA
jgi:hypothetical protein